QHERAGGILGRSSFQKRRQSPRRLPLFVERYRGMHVRVLGFVAGKSEKLGQEAVHSADAGLGRVETFAALAPLVLSLAAFILVLAAVATGWDLGSKDEGAAAHIFQLLIVGQVPIILAFLVTADWKRVMRVAGILSLQAAAIALAFAPVAYFKL